MNLMIQNFFIPNVLYGCYRCALIVSIDHLENVQLLQYLYIGHDRIVIYQVKLFNH